MTDHSNEHIDKKLDRMITILLRHENMLQQILGKEGSIMAAQDDLNAALATLATNLTAHDTAVQNEIAALTAALAAGNTAGVTAAAAAISAASTQIAKETADMVASLPATAAP